MSGRVREKNPFLKVTAAEFVRPGPYLWEYFLTVRPNGVCVAGGGREATLPVPFVRLCLVYLTVAPLYVPGPVVRPRARAVPPSPPAYFLGRVKKTNLCAVINPSSSSSSKITGWVGHAARAAVVA